MSNFAVAANPCESCPYRKEAPPGVWHRSEYEKLRWYDDESNPSLGIFLCHHTPDMKQETICRGWLTVHADSIAVRLALMTEKISPEQRDAPVSAPLYTSGNEAAEAGIKGIRRPSVKAKKIIGRLEDKQCSRSELCHQSSNAP